jgi:hypothetical protein
MTPLRRRLTEDMQVRNFSPHTQNSYVQQVSLFARHFNEPALVFYAPLHRRPERGPHPFLGALISHR